MFKQREDLHFLNSTECSILWKTMAKEVEVKWVLIVYTGGTIGMKKVNGVRKPVPDFFNKAVRRISVLNDAECAKEHVHTLGRPYALPSSNEGKRILYCIFEFPNLRDSSNIGSEDWKEMAETIEKNYEKFDGFVVIHGTDTMAYTASALSFMLENLGKPVILTGSQIPLEEIRSDGIENLLGALYLAGHYEIPEVTLFFDKKLFRGNRVTKIANDKFDVYDSPNFGPLARLDVEVEVYWDRILKRKSTDFKVYKHLDSNIGLLRLYPDITAQTVKAFLKPMQGVVLLTFGVGNGPSNNEELIRELKKATDGTPDKRGILILNCMQCLKGVVKNDYETGEILKDAGLIPCNDMTAEAAFAKLGYVLGKSKNKDEQIKMLESDLCGEISTPKQE